MSDLPRFTTVLAKGMETEPKIKSAEAIALATELAQLTGESLDTAVTNAIPLKG